MPIRDELLREVFGRRPPVFPRRSRPRRLPVPLPRGRDSYLLLSGGGAKGCFQAGALAFLGELAFRPKLICGTSVGSINAALPAAKGQAGIQELVDIWLSLRSDADMYVISPEGRRFAETLVSKVSGFGFEDVPGLVIGEPLGVPDRLMPNARTPEERERRRRRRRVKNFLAAATAIGLAPPSVTSTALGSLPAVLVVAGVSVAAAVDILKETRSILALTPIDRLIRAGLTDEVLSAWQVPCRFCYTAAENGGFGWVDHRGQVFEVDPRLEDGHFVFRRASLDVTVDSSPRALRDLLRRAILGSAAIPVAFAPQVIRTHDRPGFWINPPPPGAERPSLRASEIGQVRTALDAGVTDVAPLRAAKVDIRRSLERGRSARVISIHNSAVKGRRLPDVIGEIPGAPPRDWTTAAGERGTNVIDILTRSIDLLKDEVSRTDLIELAEFGDAVDHSVIAPRFGVNGTAQIDPGLIRIQLAYGWMTAHDEINRPHLDRWYPIYAATTQAITRLRVNAWRHELRHQSGRRRHLTWAAGALELVRRIKAAIFWQVRRRRAADDALRRSLGFRNDSFPRLGEAADRVEDWFGGFEQHLHRGRSRPNLLARRTPWMAYDDDNGDVVPEVEDMMAFFESEAP